MARAWIDEVSLECKKCGNFSHFRTMGPGVTRYADTIQYVDIFDAVKEFALDGIDPPKFPHRGNCEQGFIDVGTETFICKNCLMKALKKKRATAKAKKAKAKKR